MDEFKRRRKKNFSDEEIRCLIEGVSMTKSLLLSKLQTNDTTRQKREIWQRITANVNACTGDGLFRTIDEIKKKWKDLKAETMSLKSGDGKRNGPVGKKPPYFDYIASILDGDMNGIPIEGMDGFQITLREKVPDANDPAVTGVPTILSIVDASTVPSVKQEDDIELALSATTVTFPNDTITTQVTNNVGNAPNTYFTVEPSPAPHMHRQEPPPQKERHPMPVNVHQRERKRSKISLYAETENTDLFNEWIRSCISKNKKEEELMELKCKKLRKELGIPENTR